MPNGMDSLVIVEFHFIVAGVSVNLYGFTYEP